ncbi:pilus assembly protein TadG-related protein [Sulfitobacter guttiformis]|uniref:Putative membrane protein n=1 Tax=Sulfitobacter guttiformis TaxID=74349 RepID=A0A420DK96_9RHOB|nr:pilus assembly protein TadG-related protein [Sulfitobacter guttiformis]KIN71545.1 hypothetical protein Z949_706 [Sulfitobacter guttiformis KCTC 32187]RKE94618.1 putative membrane protein [Sulfitobacter guttiformis]
MHINPTSGFARDEDGAVAVIVALLLVVLLGFAALGVDVASLYRERAMLQSTSDLTAMSAVGHPDEATARADQTLARNRSRTDALETLELGRFLRNPAIAPEDRFQVLAAGSPGINGVRVVLQQDAPLHFARIFTRDTHVNLHRSALATRTGAASFSLSSHITNLDGDALNTLLAQEFGIDATINAGDLQRLDDTSVDLELLFAALNIEVGRNPAEILNATANGSQLVGALQTLLPTALAVQLDGLRNAAGGDNFTLRSLVGGIDTDLGLTATEFLSGVRFSALDVVRSLAATETVGTGININTNVNISGILSTKTILTAGEPPARSGLIALGEEGVQLHRAAVRLKSETKVATSLLGGFGDGIEIASVNLPIYAEVAGATATLEEIGCSTPNPLDVAARFSTSSIPLHPANGTAVAALYLGKLPESSGAVDPASLEFADMLEVNLTIPLLVTSLKVTGITIQARSYVPVGQSQSETVTFTRQDIMNADVIRSFGSGELLTSAVGGLLSTQNTEFRVKPGQEGLVAGAAAPLIATLLNALPGRLLSTLTTPVDAVLDSALGAAGLELGAGELELTGHHCETVQLVR